MADAWADVPMVEIPPPPLVACPRCRSTAYTIIRTMAVEGDGSFARRCLCKECGSRFLVIVDPRLASDWQNQLDTPVD